MKLLDQRAHCYLCLTRDPQHSRRRQEYASAPVTRRTIVRASVC